ncbi:hypothetical protein CerSpe_115620 [Prunus speciosa]
MIPAVKEDPNGVIQLYSSEKNARDSSSLPELDQILVEPGMETKRTTAVQIQHTAVATAWWLINRLVNCLEYLRTWLEETRGMLMIVATMISTTTFEAAVNPPGGVWQDNNTNSSAGGTTYCTQNNICFAGTSVAGSAFPEDFLRFETFNTVSFASLSVTLLLVGGFPLRNRIIMWLLSMAMCLTLTSMALTYTLAVLLVVPNRDIFFSYQGISGKAVVGVWIALLLTVASIHTIRFIIWLSRKLWGRFKHKIPKSLRNVVDSLVDSSRARHRTNKF